MTYQLPEEELKKFKIGLVYLFGSTAQRIDSKLSDIDIGIVFYESDILKDSLNIYNKLTYVFHEKIKPEQEIDLVFLQQTSLHLQYNVICEGKVLYAISPEFRGNYEENVLNEYLDFKPISNYFDACLIRRLK